MTGNNTNPNSSTTLRRSADEKIFAGVCGGLGEHFDINAWWFRWAFIILAFFGFAGFALYVLAWLLIPRSDGTESVAGGWFEDLDMSDAGTLFGVVLIGVAAVIIATTVFDVSGAIVIAAGLGLVGFLLYRGDIRPPVNVTITKDDDDPSPGGPSPSQAEPSQASDETKDTVPADSAAAGTVAVAAAGSVAPKPPTAPKPPKPPKVTKPKPPRSMLGRLTMAVMLIGVSLMTILELANVVHFQPFEYAAVAMGIVALGLIVGAWIGRAHWLIVIGLLIAPVLFFSAMLPKVSEWSVGDPGHLPTSAADVPESYDLGIGQLTVDLTQLTAEEFADVGRIDAEVGLGKLVVRLPSGIGATVSTDVGVGAVTGANVFGNTVLDTFQYSGIGVDQVLTVGDAPYDLFLDLEVGMGEINIQSVSQSAAGISESEG